MLLSMQFPSPIEPVTSQSMQPIPSLQLMTLLRMQSMPLLGPVTSLSMQPIPSVETSGITMPSTTRANDVTEQAASTVTRTDDITGHAAYPLLEPMLELNMQFTPSLKPLTTRSMKPVLY